MQIDARRCCASWLKNLRLVCEAVQYGSFWNMRNLEIDNITDLQALAPSPYRRGETFKVRTGKVDDYVNYLAPETVSDVDRRMQEKLPEFYGYGSQPERG